MENDSFSKRIGGFMWHIDFNTWIDENTVNCYLPTTNLTLQEAITNAKTYILMSGIKFATLLVMDENNSKIWVEFDGLGTEPNWNIA